MPNPYGNLLNDIVVNTATPDSMMSAQMSNFMQIQQQQEALRQQQGQYRGQMNQPFKPSGGQAGVYGLAMLAQVIGMMFDKKRKHGFSRGSQVAQQNWANLKTKGKAERNQPIMQKFLQTGEDIDAGTRSISNLGTLQKFVNAMQASRDKKSGAAKDAATAQTKQAELSRLRKMLAGDPNKLAQFDLAMATGNMAGIGKLFATDKPPKGLSDAEARARLNDQRRFHTQGAKAWQARGKQSVGNLANEIRGAMEENPWPGVRGNPSLDQMQKEIAGGAYDIPTPTEVPWYDPSDWGRPDDTTWARDPNIGGLLGEAQRMNSPEDSTQFVNNFMSQYGFPGYENQRRGSVSQSLPVQQGVDDKGPPTLDDIRRMVQEGVITKEEALEAARKYGLMDNAQQAPPPVAKPLSPTPNTGVLYGPATQPYQKPQSPFAPNRTYR